MGGQDEESSRGEGDEEINKGQSGEADASQANPPDDPLGVHETTPLVEDDGADHSTNVDPPGSSAGDDGAAQELAEDAEILPAFSLFDDFTNSASFILLPQIPSSQPIVEFPFESSKNQKKL